MGRGTGLLHQNQLSAYVATQKPHLAKNDEGQCLAGVGGSESNKPSRRLQSMESEVITAFKQSAFA